MRILIPLLFACAPAPAVSITTRTSPPDSRVSFQDQLDAGLLDLRGKPGRYEVGMPADDVRPYASLYMPMDAKIIGDGPEVTAIVFIGDPGGRDWRGILTASGWLITGVSLEVDSPTGAWTEQTHLIEEIGPQSGGELSYATLSHPAVAGSSRGDCLRLRCYEPTADGTADRRCLDLSVHHVVFKNCARSSVSVYAAMHGHMLLPDEDGEVHSSSRVHHTTHLNTCDQDFDGEGAGHVGGGQPVDVFEWDHNTHRVGSCRQSALAVSIYPGAVHLHHNVIDRGVDILGGNHELDHNRITQMVPNGGDPVVYVRKAGSTFAHDEEWIRPAEAGPGTVFTVAQKITAPTGIRLKDVQIIQHTAAGSIVAAGIAGLSLSSVRVTDDGPPGVRDAIRIEGTNGPDGIRSTGISIADSTFIGGFRAVVSTTGSYRGVGSFSLRGNSSYGAGAGMRCEPGAGGISGPISYAGNSMPGTACLIAAVAEPR